MKPILFFLLILSFAPLGCNHPAGTGGARPIRHVVSEAGSDRFFVMNESDDGLTSSGTCYKILENQQFEELWKVEGFYAYPGQLVLSRDGATLVRIVDLVPDTLEPSSPLIEVYRNGNLERVLPVELFVDPARAELEPLAGHHYQIVDDGMIPGDDRIRLFSGVGVNYYLSDLEEDIGDRIDDDGRYLMINSIGLKRFVVNLDSGEILTKVKVIPEHERPKEALLPWEEEPEGPAGNGT